MATSTATPTLTFKTPPLAAKPHLICAGRVTSVGAAYIGKSGKYYVSKIEITAMGAGKNHNLYFLFRDEYFNPAMTTVDLKAMADIDMDVYRKYGENIATTEEGKQSHLQGLCGGNTEMFNELASRLLSLGQDAISADPTLVSTTLSEFFVNDNPDHVFGYVLGQQTEKTGEVDPETGKNIYVPSKWLEIKSYWVVDAEGKNLAKKAKQAEKNPDRYRLAYAGESF
jgi:hypothetical protein